MAPVLGICSLPWPSPESRGSRSLKDIVHGHWLRHNPPHLPAMPVLGQSRLQSTRSARRGTLRDITLNQCASDNAALMQTWHWQIQQKASSAVPDAASVACTACRAHITSSASKRNFRTELVEAMSTKDRIAKAAGDRSRLEWIDAISCKSSPSYKHEVRVWMPHEADRSCGPPHTGPTLQGLGSGAKMTVAVYFATCI